MFQKRTQNEITTIVLKHKEFCRFAKKQPHFICTLCEPIILVFYIKGTCRTFFYPIHLTTSTHKISDRCQPRFDFDRMDKHTNTKRLQDDVTAQSLMNRV